MSRRPYRPHGRPQHGPAPRRPDGRTNAAGFHEPASPPFRGGSGGSGPAPQRGGTGAHAPVAATGPTRPAAGTLELSERGDGFLRDPAKNYALNPIDARVMPDLVRKYNLRGGEQLTVLARGNGNACVVASIEQIDGLPAADHHVLTPFEDCTVIDPREPLHFETPGGPTTMRVVDLLTPIGKGQRGLIVAPPRTGKTILLTQMATGIHKNHPDCRLMMLLIDERPEEVTEMRRGIGATGQDFAHGGPEVVYSSNDKDVQSHARIARLMIAKAKRRVERGEHVVILLDSITRLSRAFNNLVGSSGRTMSGGIDIRALTEPKSMFGAARKIENGGSLTIIASALIETGSRMDDFIFQEFKGTGNMELVLSRELANLRIWPAMDVAQSGTRKEELLLAPEAVQKIYKMRRKLMNMQPVMQMQTLVREMEQFPSNAQFLAAMRD